MKISVVFLALLAIAARPISANEILAKLQELPAVLEVKLGTLPGGELSERTLVIVNNSGNTLEFQGVRSDCGCAIGIVPKRPVLPGGELEVGLKLRPPANARDFNRRLMLRRAPDNPGGIEIQLRGSVAPALTPSRVMLRVNSEQEKLEGMEVAFQLGFGRKFDEPHIIGGGEDSRLIWTRVRFDRKNAVFNVRLNDSHADWATGTNVERVSLQCSPTYAASFEVQLERTDVFHVRPSNFDVESRDQEIRFFVVGYFEDLLASSTKPSIHIVSDNHNEIRCDVEWRSNRIAVCKATLNGIGTSNTTLKVKLFAGTTEVATLSEIKVLTSPEILKLGNEK